MLLVHHLAVVALARRLPRLVKRLEVEDIHAPGENPADTFLPVPLRVARAGHRSAVVRSTIGRPASLAVAKADLVVITRNLLDVFHGLRHVVEVGVGSIVDVLALPVRETVGEKVVYAALDDGVRSTVGELVPAVDRANLRLGECLLNLLNAVQEVVGTQTATVETFGTNSDRTDDVLVSGHARLQRSEVLVE